MPEDVRELLPMKRVHLIEQLAESPVVIGDCLTDAYVHRGSFRFPDLEGVARVAFPLHSPRRV